MVKLHVLKKHTWSPKNRVPEIEHWVNIRPAELGIFKALSGDCVQIWARAES